MSFPSTHPRRLALIPRPRRILKPQALSLAAILVFCVVPLLVRALSKTKTPSKQENVSQPAVLARLDERVSVHASGRGNPTINLSDGRALMTSYVGPEDLRAALEGNRAEPLSLASADFDEDGVPDLVSGYGYEGRGIVTLLRGNVDAIYPNAPDAQKRKANGSFTDAPFLSPAHVFEATAPADFIAAGDFDCDTHWDVVMASRDSSALYLLSGDGKGFLASPKVIELPGRVTALTFGEVNRRDGLTDIAIGVQTSNGPKLMVFEGPEGALRAEAEVFSMPGLVTSLAMGQLDDEYTMDLAVAAGNELVIVLGRDRKLSLDREQQATVLPPRTDRRSFRVAIKGLTIGDFSGRQSSDIAVLSEDGSVELIGHGDGAGQEYKTTQQRTGNRSLTTWQSRKLPVGPWSDASSLVTARVSGQASDDLVLLDAHDRQLHILTSRHSNAGEGTAEVFQAEESYDSATLNVESSAAVSVFPMRLNQDALSDLVMLKGGHSSAIVMEPQAAMPFTVNSAADTDDGVCNTSDCTLREAINAANGNVGADTIKFVIGTGLQTITLTSPLPNIVDAVTIDGTEQPGFEGIPVIELNGAGLSIRASNCAVRGLVINRIEILNVGNGIIEGNYVGTDASGTVALPNASGVILEGSTNTTIGGTTASARNVAVGANGVRVTFGSGQGGGHLIQGNYVGTNAAGTQFLGGTVQISSGSNHAIGGTVVGAGNVTTGVVIGNSLLSMGGTLIQGNFVGTDVTGTRSLGGGGDGVRIAQPSSNTTEPVTGTTIGGTVLSARNIISGKSASGVFLANEEVRSTLVQGNYIGTDISGTEALGNGSGVVMALGTSANTIGGNTAAARNIISANLNRGVFIGPSIIQLTSPNLVTGNFIGTDFTGTRKLGNRGTGVSVEVAGGVAAHSVSGNVISNNQGNGVSISLGATVSTSTTAFIGVTSNYIGTDLSGTLEMGNAHDGVLVNARANGNRVRNNTIAFNGDNGVNVPGTNTSASVNNIIEFNSIFSNGALGINLGDAGVTMNDPRDEDIGGNNLQNFPVLTSFALASAGKDSSPPSDLNDEKSSSTVPASITVNGTFHSTPNRNFIIHWQFTTDDQCISNQQNSRPLDQDKVGPITTDANGDATFEIPFQFPQGTSRGVINCLAVDEPSGNTSEFSACFPVSAPSAITISDVSQSEGNSGTTAFTFTVNLSPASNQTVTVNYATADDTATVADNDYASASNTLTFNPGQTAQPLTVLVNGDARLEPAETFVVNLSSASNATISDSQGVGTIVNDDSAVQFTAAAFTVSENGGTASVSVTRTGDITLPASVNFATSDTAGLDNCSVISGKGSGRCDYITTVGTANFAAGQSTRNISIPVVDDSYAEGTETFTITLSNASGATLGAPNTATVTINDNEASNGPNPIDGTPFFVRQQYLDFLNREPDPAGFADWQAILNGCAPLDTTCDRIHVSSAFFRSPEFSERGYFIYRFYPVSFGRKPIYTEFTPDIAKVSGFLTDAELEAARVAFVNEFVTRTEFTTKYNGLNNTQFVDTLLSTAGITHLNRDSWITSLNGGTKTRAQVLREIAETTQVYDKFFNEAFVVMQYFGYLRREPDAQFLVWITELNTTGNFRNMINGFMNSTEYRNRFGPQDLSASGMLETEVKEGRLEVSKP